MDDIVEKSTLEDCKYTHQKYASVCFAMAQAFLSFERNNLKISAHNNNGYIENNAKKW